MATRWPFVCRIVIKLTDAMAAETFSAEAFMESIVDEIPDATMGELKEAWHFYLSQFPANDNPHIRALTAALQDTNNG